MGITAYYHALDRADTLEEFKNSICVTEDIESEYDRGYYAAQKSIIKDLERRIAQIRKEAEEE